MGSIWGNYTFNFTFASVCAREKPRTGKPMDFTPEVEYEVIREAASKQLDRPLVNPWNKASR